MLEPGELVYVHKHPSRIRQYVRAGRPGRTNLELGSTVRLSGVSLRSAGLCALGSLPGWFLLAEIIAHECLEWLTGVREVDDVVANAF
jgi:hypothetical protein